MSVTLITGVTGFVGRHLVDVLRSEKTTRLVGLDMSAPRGKKSLDGFLQGDVSNVADVADAIETTRPDRVFHLAGVMGADSAMAERVNVGGTANVLESVARSAPGAAVLVIGSAAEYGPRERGAAAITEDAECTPRDVYGSTKLVATRAAQAFGKERGIRVVIVRPFNIIGAGMSESLVVGGLVKRAIAATHSGDGTLRVGNLDAVRDFIDVADVANGCVAALDKGASGEIYNLCSGRAVSVRQVADRIISLSGRDLRLSLDPALDRGADASVGSPGKSKKALGFMPRISLEQSLDEIWSAAIARERECASAS